MFGDYYTHDLVSASPETSMIGNQIDQFTRQGSQKTVGAVLTVFLAAVLLDLHALLPAPDAARGQGGDRELSWLRNPWGRPRFLPIVTALYILWSIVPVTIAVLFAFNDGRSRTTWQGFSTRWFTGDPGSVRERPGALVSALQHTLLLAVICVVVAVPLGRRPRARPPALARLRQRRRSTR